MVSLASLWLPILLSAVAVFLLSTVIHMVLKYHHRDYDKLPDEDAFVDYLRASKVGPGNYIFPCALTVEERKDPAVIEKMTQGPTGSMTVLPGLTMGKNLGAWFVLCLVIGLFVAYVASLCLPEGAEYMSVFRLVATVAWLGYAGSTATESIWMGRRWSTSFRHIFDGLLYAVTTGGFFGWLWP